MYVCMSVGEWGGGSLNKKYEIKRKKEKVDQAKSVKQQEFT